MLRPPRPTWAAATLKGFFDELMAFKGDPEFQEMGEVRGLLRCRRGPSVQRPLCRGVVDSGLGH